jgi:hypothetical protein
MGVDVVRVDKPFQVDTVLLDEIQQPKGKLETVESAYGYAWGHATNDDIVALNKLVKKGHTIFWTAEKFEANGKTYPEGTMIVKNRDGLLDDMDSIIQELWVHFEGLWAEPKVKTYALKEPRVGLYKSWTASMDEGWTRWVLEQYEIPFKSVFDKEIRKGDLIDIFDVIIIPDLRESAIIEGVPDSAIPAEYAGGIGEIGLNNLINFVKNGGAVITLNGGADFVIKHFHLGVENSVQGLSRRDFFIPGSILKALNDTSHPIAYGYERGVALFYRRSPAFVVHEGQSVVRYPTEILLSGWVTGDKHLINKTAIADVPYGQGKVIMIGFPVVYRGQSHATFRYLFNAIYYGLATLTE